MTDPVLVEVVRGNRVESAHRGSVSVVDADGHIVMSIGDVEGAVFPRSAVKAIQALPLIESGAADAFGFGDCELALACASHNGEATHVALAAAMLARAGLDETALECGTHWPSLHAATLELARSGGKPNALHNNCSGKHSSFLCVCRHAGIAHEGYAGVGHPFQEMVRQVMSDVTGEPHEAEDYGIDGCSIPTYPIPLKALAYGFARMATGTGIAPERGKAAKRLMTACMAEPFLVAGSKRADTQLMKAAPGRIFVKIGAEGVYCAAIPELGLGIALKCDDGAGRAAEVMVAAVLARLTENDKALSETLAAIASPAQKNWNGIEIGRHRPTAALG